MPTLFNHTNLQYTFNLADGFHCLAVGYIVDIEDGIGIITLCCIAHLCNIDIILREGSGKLCKHVRNIAVNDSDSSRCTSATHIYIWKINGVVDITILQIILHLLYCHDGTIFF